jgi:O-antigen/teichoic acid export membrane protein
VLLLNLAGLLTGLKRAALAELLVNVMRPLLMVAGVVVLWFAQRQPIPAPTILAVYLAASVTMVAVCLVSVHIILHGRLARAGSTYAVRDWMRSGSSFMAVTLVATIHERIDLLIMGAIASSADVAVYAVAVRFAQTVVVAVSAAGAVMAPYFVERLADLRKGRRDEVQLLIRNTARTAFYVSLIALAAFAILGPSLLKLFGPHYQQAYAPLLLLATGHVLCALAGPAAAVATLSGQAGIAVVALIIGIIVNGGLNLMLVPLFSANGAALATGAGMITTALIGWGWTRRHLRLDTSVFRTNLR